MPMVLDGTTQFPDNQATTACERIGNLELHKTLPIQSLC